MPPSTGRRRRCERGLGQRAGPGTAATLLLRRAAEHRRRAQALRELLRPAGGP
jgi:hypothetical protein